MIVLYLHFSEMAYGVCGAYQDVEIALCRKENQNSSRQAAKALSSAVKKGLLFFATFACFALSRETGLSV